MAVDPCDLGHGLARIGPTVDAPRERPLRVRPHSRWQHLPVQRNSDGPGDAVRVLRRRAHTCGDSEFLWLPASYECGLTWTLLFQSMAKWPARRVEGIVARRLPGRRVDERGGGRMETGGRSTRKLQVDVWHQQKLLVSRGGICLNCLHESRRR